MNINEFFDLTSAEQDKIISVYRLRKRIQADMEHIKEGRTQLAAQLSRIQEDCPHPLLQSTTHSNEDEFGTMIKGSVTTNYCPDCEKRWRVSDNE